MTGPKVVIYDTTLRDGSQGEKISFSVLDKILITKKLDELGVDMIEAGWPGSNPKDEEYFREARKLKTKHARIVAFGSTRHPKFAAKNDPNLRAIVAAGTDVVTIFGKSWDLHVTKVYGVPLEKNLEMIQDSVAFLRKSGRTVVYDAEHFFDGFRENEKYAIDSIGAAIDGGAEWIVLCETNGGRLPSEVAATVRRVRARFPKARLGIHTHDDGGLGVANALAAVEEGVLHVQGTFNGYGERTGNANLATIIANLQIKMGYAAIPPDRLKHLTTISRSIDEIANLASRDNAPYVGRSAFAHKAGVHVNAVSKAARTYEHIPPETVGNTRRVLVSELSGKSNIQAMLDETGLAHLVGPEDAQRVVRRVKDLEHHGYEFEGAGASLGLLIRRETGSWKPLFEMVSFSVSTDKTGAGPCGSRALLKIRVEGREELTAGEGNGPVNALDQALRRALDHSYPQLRRMRLVDYKVRIVDGSAGTAAKTRVLIESRDGARLWSTVGASENIIEASWQALTDSVAYMLLGGRSSGAGRRPARRPAAH